MAQSTGHVFVVHGRIESMVHDYAIVPTSTSFSIRGYWKPVLGAAPERLRPPGWPGPGFARAKGRKDVWFVNVGGRYSAGAEVILERAAAAIDEIAQSSPTAGQNRSKPLVAVPVLGIAGGGLGRQRGDVIRRQLAQMRESAKRNDVDIAIVTPDASVYAATQHLRRGDAQWGLEKRQSREARRLGELAKKGQLALFLGAGVSVPAGLPSWSGLLAGLARSGRLDLDDRFSELTALDQAQYLDHELEDLGAAVAAIVRKSRVPSPSHALLASLGCREAVTTNYDRLYEKAVRMQRGKGRVATVMPWQPPRSGQPWILKMHGDVGWPETIVLTRSHFVNFDSETRPAGALLQTLLMTRHMLFVGASLNDDNVIRLAYEVDRFRRRYDLAGEVGTLLDVDDDPVRRRLWQGQLSWLAMSGSNVADRARSLEIFLDAVAAHASDDASWLLDDRFKALLGSDEGLVAKARDLYERASAAGGEWQSLADSLAKFGASGPTRDVLRSTKRPTSTADADGGS